MKSYYYRNFIKMKSFYYRNFIKMKSFYYRNLIRIKSFYYTMTDSLVETFKMKKKEFEEGGGIKVNGGL